jgi:hypothetical protein
LRHLTITVVVIASAKEDVRDGYIHKRHSGIYTTFNVLRVSIRYRYENSLGVMRTALGTHLLFIGTFNLNRILYRPSPHVDPLFGFNLSDENTKVTVEGKHTNFRHLSHKTMMKHGGKNVVFTGTDFVMRDDTANKAPRRSTNYSSKTEATLSTVSTDITKRSIDEKEKEEQEKEEAEPSEQMIRKIASKMLESLQKNGSLINGDASNPSGDGTTKTSGSSARDAELAALSDLILSSFETEHAGNSDKNLRNMLREGLEESECSTQVSSEVSFGRSFAESKTQSTRSGTTESRKSTRSGTTESGKSTRSGTTESGLSRASMNGQNSYKAPMDIWNPDFWNGDDGEDAGPDATAGMGEEISGSPLDFITGGMEISSESSDEDDSSVWSDMTGLTGVFPDFPEGRRSIKEEVLSTSSIHSIVASKDKVKTKNPVVCYSLRFDKVVVRKYTRILNDNPACTKGPSVGLGWEFDQEAFDIEDYEMERGRLRRTHELMLNRAQREKLVRDLGYTERDIAAAVRGANKIKSQRRQTINNLGATQMEEAVENAARRVKNIIFLRNK